MITYNGPIGEAIENPDSEFIKDIFFIKAKSIGNKEAVIRVLK